jgi:two-component system, NtrC family, sensor kinase
MPLKTGDWTLAYEQVEDDAFSEIRRVRVLVLTIFVFGSLGIVLVALLFSRKVVRQIEKADLEKEMMNEQVIEAGKMASIGELAAGIAHEINNPVAIMVEEAGWMEDLLDEEELKKSQNVEEFRRSLKQISLQGVRCKEITHKLLSFARKTDPVHHEIQVNDIIEEILSICDQRSKFSNIRIQTELDGSLPNISASPTELQQVFMNLINNAIDAMGSGGGLLEIRSGVEGDKVVVDVADTGHGISKEVISRMFEPFFTTKPVGKGTGLGLSICYGIIKKLGGNLTVDSSVGLGTTFHVYIPIHEGSS